jgi:hypothetical protein
MVSGLDVDWNPGIGAPAPHLTLAVGETRGGNLVEGDAARRSDEGRQINRLVDHAGVVAAREVIKSLGAQIGESRANGIEVLDENHGMTNSSPPR